jgi:hypothetical protein
MRPTASKAEVEFANCVAIYFDQSAARPTHSYQHNTISTSYPLQAMNNVRKAPMMGFIFPGVLNEVLAP